MSDEKDTYSGGFVGRVNRRRLLAALGVGATSGCLRLDQDETDESTRSATATTSTEGDGQNAAGGDGGGGEGGDADDGEDTTNGALETVLVGPDDEFVFEPEELTVEPGTTVRWTWRSDNHAISVEAKPADADWSGHETPENEQFEYEHTFEVLGEYEYHCLPHESVGMVGAVTVTDRPDEPGNTYESETSIDAVADDWGQFAFDATNVGASATTGPSELLPAWRYEFEEDGGADDSPVVSDGRVFAGTRDRVFAFDATTGAEEWTVSRPDEPFIRGVEVVDGTVYVPRKSGVSAHDATTGDSQWSTTLDTRVSSRVTATSDVVAVALSREEEAGGVVVLEAETGERRWSYHVDGATYWRPAIAGSSVYVQSQAPGVVSLDATTGDVEWTFDADEYPTSPTVVDDVVYVLDQASGTAYALAGVDGTELWSYDVGDRGAASPVVSDGLVVGYGRRDDEWSMWAVDAETGEERWRRTGADSNALSPAVADGRVYTTAGTTVKARDLADGALVAERSFPAPGGFTDPVVADGVVFVGGEELHAFAGP